MASLGLVRARRSIASLWEQLLLDDWRRRRQLDLELVLRRGRRIRHDVLLVDGEHRQVEQLFGRRRIVS
jgi:hypothetical protein